ncbi:tetratricopeptide repeat protein [Flavitalea antarctica]
MITSKKLIVFSVTAVLLITAAAVFFFSSSPFRKELPVPPGALNYPKTIIQQLESQYRKAYYFTSARTIGTLGMAYQANLENEKAAICYRLAIKKDPQQWLWHYYSAKLQLEQGEPLKAIAAFHNVVNLEPDNLLARYYMGEANQKTGGVREAMKMFSYIINAEDNHQNLNPLRETNFPVKTYAQFQLARLFNQYNQPDSAVELLTQIISAHLNFGPAYRLLGSIYLNKDSISMATRLTVRANDLADYFPPGDKHLDDIALLSRSEEYLLKQIDDAIRSDNFTWALTLSEHALNFLPLNRQVISHYIRENIRQGNSSVAKNYLDQHLSLYSNDRKELLEFIDLLYDNGLPEEALQYFNQLRILMPENPVLPVWLYKRGKRTEGMSIINGMLKKYPHDENILASVITMLLEAGDIEKAEQYLTSLKAKNTQSAESIKLSGLIAEKKNDLVTALQLYEDAFNAGEKSLTFCKELSGTFMRLKNWQKADEYFKLSLNVHPNEPELLESYGKFLLACPETKFRSLPGALEYSERAFINVYGNYETRLSAGKNVVIGYISSGDKKKAAFFINQTLALAKKGNRQEEYIEFFRALTSAP